ncbi:MAG: prephenate dehydratase [Thermoproteota archaeon]
MSRMASDIESLRKRIDEIDQELVNLMCERFSVVKELGKIKRKAKLPSVDVSRRTRVLRNVERLGEKGGLDPSFVRSLFEHILAYSEKIQGQARVAYLGPKGTFCMDAVERFFGSSIDSVAQREVIDVFKAVRENEATFGVIPVENSLEGVYGIVLDALINSDLKIVGEVILPVSHCLASARHLSLGRIRSIYSHPQAFAQCGKFLHDYVRKARRYEVSSTAKAAMIVRRMKYAAAICSKSAANLYGLKILATNIEDEQNNFTRFLVFSKQAPSRTTNAKTSIVFSVKHVPGALHEALTPFASRNINLTKIESRPVRGQPWEYMFFIDLLGHAEDQNVSEALNELSKLATRLKVLGSYPRWE